jgi:hypothetical protein
VKKSGDHLLKQRPKAPKIGCFVALFFHENLRSCVLGHSRDRKDIFLASFDFFGKAKISELDITFPVDHDVFWLEITVYDVFFVHVLKS